MCGIVGILARQGSLTIHRFYGERPLQLDVNLLASEFPMALADALDRVIIQEAILLPAAAEREGLFEHRRADRSGF